MANQQIPLINHPVSLRTTILLQNWHSIPSQTNLSTSLSHQLPGAIWGLSHLNPGQRGMFLFLSNHKVHAPRQRQISLSGLSLLFYKFCWTIFPALAILLLFMTNILIKIPRSYSNCTPFQILRNIQARCIFQVLRGWSCSGMYHSLKISFFSSFINAVSANMSVIFLRHTLF